MVKTTIALLLAFAALPIDGFTITMSSYLDKIASGQVAGLTSFAPSQNSYGSSSSSYSYGSSPVPAPAPAQSSFSYGGGASASFPVPAPTSAYVNGFAHIQPNNSLNYIATLGGGSAKKWGRDYSGVSSTFRPTYSVGNAAYLDNLKDKVFTLSQPQSPPPVTASQSSYSYDPAAWMGNSVPAPSPSYSYGGAPAAPAPSSNPSYSYGGSVQPAAPSYSYGGSPAAPVAPSNPSYSYGGSPAAPVAPSNPSYSYGGSAQPATPSYSYGGSPAAPAAPSNPSYSYGGSPSYGAPAVSTAPKSTSSYLESL